MSVPFYFDHNMQLAVATALRDRGFNVLKKARQQRDQSVIVLSPLELANDVPSSRPESQSLPKLLRRQIHSSVRKLVPPTPRDSYTNSQWAQATIPQNGTLVILPSTI